MDLSRQWPDKVYALDRQKLAYLLEPDLRFATSNDSADSFSFDPS